VTAAAAAVVSPAHSLAHTRRENSGSLCGLIEDLELVEAEALAKNSRSLSGTLAGQLVVLLAQYASGRPSLDNLRGFLRCMTGERA